MEDTDFLRAALRGYEQQLANVEAKIAEIESRLNGAVVKVKVQKKKPRRISAEGRARIAAAQRARWASTKR